MPKSKNSGNRSSSRKTPSAKSQTSHKKETSAEQTASRNKKTAPSSQKKALHPKASPSKKAQHTQPTKSNRRSTPPPPPRPADSFGEYAASVFALLAEEPLNAAELGNRLQLSGEQRRRLQTLLTTWEKEGRIARIRRDRYVLPEEADLFTGEIQFHPNGSAHVLNPERGGADVFISPENTATAMHGDKVVARIMTEKTGRREPTRREGRIIRVLERKNARLVGTLQTSQNFFYVVADDPRFIHNLYVPTPAPSLQARPGDKVVARLDAWESRHINPEGTVVEVLGRAGDPGVDMLAIIRKFHLPEDFPGEVLAEASRLASRDPAEEAQQDTRRLDCRKNFVFTIDPDDARDFDDAIQVEEIAGGWRVGIHIADVAHYVQPESALDHEAAKRGNSVYLPDRVIPMLPEVLSNGLCSLRPQEDRLAFSVFAEITQDGAVRRTEFARTIIRSSHRLTYREALALLEKQPADEISTHVHRAWAVSSRLRRCRFEKGSLDLDFPETKVILDEEGHPLRIEKVENDISHQLIEELMLLANETVAREMRLRRQPTIYRIHEDPDPEKLLEFRELAHSLGVRCGDLTGRPELQKLLRRVRGESFEYAVKVGLLKSLKRAQYSEEPLGHYGLAKADYLHFTSPIRRYADLVAHRALARHLGLVRQGPDSRALPELALHISGTERNAAEAEREAVKRKKLEFFQRQLTSREGAVFLARVLEVRNFGMFVELPAVMVSGLIHVSSMDDDFYVFDPARGCFVGRRNRRTFEVGQEIEVLVSRVDLFKQQIDFRLAPPDETPGSNKKPSSGMSKKNKKLPATVQSAPSARRKKKNRRAAH